MQRHPVRGVQSRSLFGNHRADHPRAVPHKERFPGQTQHTYNNHLEASVSFAAESRELAMPRITKIVVALVVACSSPMMTGCLPSCAAAPIGDTACIAG